ncbi:MAG: thioredoxin domain-containing protein [Candidatus Eremiobacteraeota bacterium]|nr:thioredoxin domain-containing protein [Candidatus Eremiobacteraeota bacterium]
MATLHFSPRPNRASEIRWRPWGAEAFAQAQAEGKPLLLAISAVWCHWCHVMDETSYSDPGVIELINERFVPVRVDNDQRPDVNARYNMGGWPSTAILSPEGEILRGGTYLPPENMLPFLQQVSDLYADPANRLEFARRIAEVKAKRAAAKSEPSGALDSNAPAAVVEAASEAFDDDFGGFGSEPKFPHVDLLHLLLDVYARSGGGRVQTMVQMTLRGMAGGGMYDHVEGGFFRYSTTRDFSVPHFEKMLEDLCGELHACARASVLFGDEALGRIAIDTKRYMDAVLWQPSRHGYGGSQDADETYYGLGKDGRANAEAPYVDPIIYTSWNAQAALALIESGPLLGEQGLDAHEWTARGLEILDMLWSTMLVDGLMTRFFDGAPQVRGLLGDQAWSAWAALGALGATGDRKWLDRAAALMKAIDPLYDDASETYRDRLAEDDPGRLADPVAPLPENALVARVLLALAAISGDEQAAVRASSLLARLAKAASRVGIFGATYASAVLDLEDPPFDIKMEGDALDARAREMRDQLARIASPPLRIVPAQPADAETHAASSCNGAPLALVCRKSTCFARASDAAEVLAAIARARSAAP